MAEISITVLCAADDRLSVRLEGQRGPLTTEVEGPTQELILDLIGQLRLARMAGGAARHLSDILGRVLFAAPLGDALREAIRDDAAPMVLLATDPRIAEWPWELARDPEFGTALALEATLMAREVGAPVGTSTGSRRAILIVPGENTASHAGTLQAATRPLGRKLGVDVFPVEPVTGPGLRRSLARGALFVHIEAAVEGDTLALDDGQVPIDRIGLDGDTWLVVLGGTEVTLALHGRIRALGVPLVLGAQIALEPSAAAALDRELYRALAAGESVGEAVRRARRALLRFGGLDGHAWAAPVLWAAPGVRPLGSPAAQSFPPPTSGTGADRREPGATLLDMAAVRLGAPSAPPLGLTPVSSGGMPTTRAPSPPLSAPAFIQETIRCMREGPRDAELVARIEALRSLGGSAGILQNDPELAELSPSERTTRLADRLVETISQPAGDLALPADLDVRLRRASAATGLSPARLGFLAQVLRAGQGLALTEGEGSHRRRVLRALAEEVFDVACLVARSDDGDRLVGGPGESGFGGWFYEAVTLNWRRDELDPFRLDGAPPGHRVPVVTRGANGPYSIRRGVWLLAAPDMQISGEPIRNIARALEQGALLGVAGGRLFRVPIPADFRILLSINSSDALASSGVPSVPTLSSLEPGPHGEGHLQSERERWLANAEVKLGPAADVAEGRLRDELASRLIDRYAALTSGGAALESLPFEAALVLAGMLGGDVEARVDAALAVYFTPPEPKAR